MRPTFTFARDLRELAQNTLGAWWAALPQVLTVLTLSWFGYQALTQLAAVSIQVSAWLALALMAVAFVVSLSGTIVALRLLGLQLGMRDALPLPGEDRRDESVTHLLALTLLPFLGIYAVFDKVTEAAARLQLDYAVMFGLDFVDPLLDQLDPWREGGSVWVIVGLIAALYMARRGLELWFERTRWRPLGVAAALVEGFFLFLVVLSGRQVALRLGTWADGRVFRQWLDYPGWGLDWLFTRLGLDFRDGWAATSAFVVDVLAPGLSKGLLYPLLWLAIASLVFGSQVVSLGDVWRRGQPVAARLGTRHAVGVGDRSRGVAIELQEAFLGDVSDKYLPTWQSLRLVLGLGTRFLGAFILCYAAVDLASTWFARGLDDVIGGHPYAFWSLVGPFPALLGHLVFEPIRLAILAAAFRLCLRQWADASGSLTPSSGPDLRADKDHTDAGGPDAASSVTVTRDEGRS